MVYRETTRELGEVAAAEEHHHDHRHYSTTDKVIIFDWDDTICPSSFVDRFQVEHVDELPAKVSAAHRRVDKCGCG